MALEGGLAVCGRRKETKKQTINDSLSLYRYLGLYFFFGRIKPKIKKKRENHSILSFLPSFLP
jgi:hypothetical protein